MKKQRRKKSKPITGQIVQQLGTRYLQRYVPSVSHYRKVLIRNIDKRLRELETGDREAALQLIEDDIQKRLECGALDDERFAVSWAQHLHEKGKSFPQIKNVSSIRNDIFR